MSELKLTIRDKYGNNKCQETGTGQLVLVYEGPYEPGDQIVFETSQPEDYYVLRVDDTMEEAYVYFAEESVVFTLPFDEKKISYNPKSFTGGLHYITMRQAEEYENRCYRNLAKNVMDQHGNPGCFPHVHANVETRGESVFAARNAIDGILANKSHGPWPYQSWGINRREDAELTLDFGRPVDVDKVVLYTRADFPHDSWWTKAAIEFSDGTKTTVSMEKSVMPHVFSIRRENITWLTLKELIKAADPSPFPALSQIEVYGVNHLSEK